MFKSDLEILKSLKTHPRAHEVQGFPAVIPRTSFKKGWCPREDRGGRIGRRRKGRWKVGEGENKERK
jgi:hypothetical protein